MYYVLHIHRHSIFVLGPGDSNMAAKLDRPKSDATESLLTCPVCLEYYVEPKSLICLHTFCSACLEKVQNRLRKLIVCPMCKTITPLSPRGVKGLPTDFKIEQMKEFLQKDSESPSDNIRFCDVCKGNDRKEASFHCPKCSVFYCGSCVARHKSNPMFQNHVINDLSTDAMNNALLCHKHQNHLVSFYCRSCKPHSLLCPICILDHDSKHDISELTNVAESIRKDLMEGLVKVKEKSELFQEYLSKVRVKKELYDKMLTQVQEGISKRALELTEAVHREEIRMLNEAQEKFEEIISRYKEDSVSSALSNMDTLQINIENVTNGSNEACVASYEKLSEQIKDMKNTATLPQNIPQTGLQFIRHVSQISLGSLATCKLPEIQPKAVEQPEPPTVAKVREPQRDFTTCDDCQRQRNPLYSIYSVRDKKLKRLCRMCKGMENMTGGQAKRE